MEHRASETGAVLNPEGAPMDQWDMESPIPVALERCIQLQAFGLDILASLVL